MNAPQILIIVITALGAGIALSEHGKPRTGTHNFWVWAIAVAIELSILNWGGFFN